MPLLWSRAFVLAFVANFFLSLSFYLLIPTLPVHLITGVNVPASWVGVVLSAYVVAGLLVRPFSGLLIDRYPRKSLYLIMLIAFALCAACYGLAQSLWVLIALRVIHGLVWGILIPAGNTYVLDLVPPARRGEGIGYYGMAMNLAMAAGPLAGIYLLDNLGFRSVIITALGTALCGVLAAAFLPSIHAQRHAAPKVRGIGRFVLREGLPGAWVMLLLTLSYGLLLAYAALYGKQNHLDGTAFFFVLVAAGFVIARLVGSAKLDRGGAVRLAAVGASLAVVALLVLALVPTFWFYLAAGMLAGSAYGFAFPAIQHWILERAEMHRRGTANSTYFTAFDIGAGGGMLLGGFFVQSGLLQQAWLLVAMCALMATVLAMRLDAKNHKPVR